MMRIDPVYGRLVWKEYRAQRGFWLALAVAALAMMLLFAKFLEQRDGANALLGIAMLMPAFYALGSGAMLFAAEREEGTSELLSSLAPRKESFYLAKVGFSLGSTLLLAIFLSLMAEAIAYGRSGQDSIISARDLTLSLCAIFAVFGWAAFFSAVCRKVLTAVILAGAAFVLTTIVTQDFLAKFVSDPTVNISGAVIDSSLAHLLEGFSLLALAGVFAGRLLGGRSFGFTLPRLPRLIIQDETPRSRLDDWAATRTRTAPGLKLFGRLLWIELRQALTFGHAAWLGATAFLIFLSLSRVPISVPDAAVFITAPIPWLLGIWAFQSEGGTRLRPLAERGVSPTVVWLSRHVVWAGPALLTTLLLVAVAWSMNYLLPDFGDRRSNAILWFPALGYAVAQFASMLNRRGIMAAFCGALLYIVFGVWSIWTYGSRVPWWLSLAPIPLIFLVATWAWSRNWLLERSSYQSLLRLGGAIGVALFLVWGSVGVYRVHEIPLPEVAFPGSSVPSLASILSPRTNSYSPDETETAKHYSQAIARLNGMEPSLHTRQQWSAIHGWEQASNDEHLMLESNQEALELALAAAARDVGSFPRPALDDLRNLGSVTLERHPLQLAHLLLLSARSFESQGKLDEARDRYLATLRLARHVAHHAPLRAWQIGTTILDTVAAWIPRWATHPGQTPGAIEAMAQAVTRELEIFPPLSEALKINQNAIRDAVESDDDVEHGAVGRLPLFQFCLPWEQARALRVLDLASISQARFLEQVDSRLLQQVHSPPSLAPSDANVPHPQPDATYDPLPALDLWVSTTPLLNGGSLGSDVADRAPTDNRAIRNIRITNEIVRRALPLELRLIAWKKEHGAYPPRLDSLPAVARASTIDPWTGREFVYFPGREPRRPEAPELPTEVSDSDPLESNATMAGMSETVETGQVAFGTFGPLDAKHQKIPGVPDPTQANPTAAHPLSANSQRFDHQIWFMLP